MHYLATFTSVFLFWLLLSGYFTILLISLGIFSALLVVWLLWRMDQVDKEVRTISRIPAVILYGFWLLWQVVKSNIDVARRIWDPNLPIQPTWRRLDTNISSVLETTFYANSITLTPGTLTVDVEEDHFVVHSLSEEALLELLEGDMERRIRRIGI
ncbi:MAG: Na+/H+ antiporter subunit E [Motiliproteus sp.]|nr:Na+/H+ antiporter subunit E [Motiliproteus sp.]